MIAVDHKTRIGEPKTIAGTRVVSLDPATVAVLRAWRARQAEERLLVGAGYQEHDLVFAKPSGEPLNPERVSREFDRRVERWHSPRITLHGLRHAWATLALRANVHPRVVQERFGQAHVSVTLGIYSHVTPGLDQDAAALVAGSFL